MHVSLTHMIYIHASMNIYTQIIWYTWIIYDSDIRYQLSQYTQTHCFKDFPRPCIQPCEAVIEFKNLSFRYGKAGKPRWMLMGRFNPMSWWIIGSFAVVGLDYHQQLYFLDHSSRNESKAHQNYENGLLRHQTQPTHQRGIRFFSSMLME